jgi:hypothetical protein
MSSELYLQDEMAHAKVSLPPPLIGRKYHLFCSEFNAGAPELAEALRESDVFVTKGKGASAALTFTTYASQLAQCDHSSQAMPRTDSPLPPGSLLTCLCSSLGWPVLVLLDKRTWTSGANTASFVEHVHKVMRVGLHIICVHELPAVVGPHRHACDFALMVRPHMPRTRSSCAVPRWAMPTCDSARSSTTTGRPHI